VTDHTNSDTGAGQDPAAEGATASETPAIDAEVAAADGAVDAAVALAAAAAAAEADEKAQREGFADAKAKEAAEAVAAAKAKAPRKPRASKKKPGGGFKTLALDPEGRAKLAQLVADRVPVKIALGDENRVQGELPVTEAMLSPKRRLFVSTAALNFTGAALTRGRRITHVYGFAPDRTINDAPLVRVELAAPLMVSPGEQLQLPPGGVAF